MLGETELRKKICLLGDPAVGKTSLINRFVYNVFDDKYLSTIGAKISKKNVVVSRGTQRIPVTLTIWDIAGQKSFEEVKSTYYRGARGALIVCDITRKSTLSNLQSWADSLFKIAGRVPVVFVCNKADLEENAMFSVDDLGEIAHFYKAPCFLTSAKLGTNINVVFETLASRMIEGG
jgi:small GTP-binding protein